jgi:hydroxymethylbilane synthase
MTQAIFISREVGQESPISAVARESGMPLYHESLISFSAVPFTEIPAVDWVFFASRRAVQYFFRGLQQTGRTLNRQVQIGVLGDGTGKALKEFGKPADFAGNGDPEIVGPAFKDLAVGKRVLFPGARHSRRSMQKQLTGSLEIHDLIVYDNHIRTDWEVPDCSYLVFTSPLNVQSWRQRYSFTNPDQQIIAIGQTTAKAVRDLGGQVLVAEHPSEKGLASALRQKIKES